MRYRLDIEYHGADFSGWQRQQGKITVQGVLENAFQVILKQDVLVQGSGRTDAGVHALGQVAHIDIEESVDPHKIMYSVNALVRPYRVCLRSMERTADDFHARFSALKRYYEYRIQNTPYPSVLQKDFVWYVAKNIDTDLMQKAANYMLGKHDFSSFRAAECQAKSPIKTLDHVSIISLPQMVVCKFEAKSFLHHQVRNMVGTLVQVGLGKISVEKFKDILEACDRTKAGPTAPPEGLFFVKVDY